MINVKLYDEDWNEVELPGVQWLEFTPSPQTANREVQRVGNRDEIISEEKEPRLIETRFLVRSGGYIYYKLIRDELFDIFDPTKKYFIVDFEASAKVWEVRVDDYKPVRTNARNAEVSMRLYSRLPHAFSKGTTLDEFTYDAELWGYGMGLVYDEGTQDYIHNTSAFNIYNAGNQTVDPRESELVIKIKSLGGSSSTMTLTNVTTGDEWSYTGTFENADEIMLDGVKMKRNTANIVGDTNFGLITLKKGMNQFTLTGITGAFEISFEFRYLYA